MDYARARQWDQVELNVESKNKPAITLYESMGFLNTGEGYHADTDHMRASLFPRN
jgi:ribosomal protein S18 acetylase RimI-like enzyme